MMSDGQEQDILLYIEHLEAERDALAAHIERLTSDIHELMDNSDGVAGLHLNSDVALWADLTKGGRFESWLLSLEDAPEASLALHDADLLDNAALLIDVCGEARPYVEALRRGANDKRRQADTRGDES